MAGGPSGTSRELDQTPTWAVAGVCAVIIIISFALEKSLHKLGRMFTEKHKKQLYEALDKVKAELMILGFISLILTFTQYYIAKICIPIDVADKMLPCPAKVVEFKKEGADKNGRRLLSYDFFFEGRMLAGGYDYSCAKKGKVSMITTNGLHQLHILIFFLAVSHVIYSAVTMALGKLKIRGWKVWEKHTHNYEFSTDPSRFRLAHETSFVRAHTSFWTRITFFFVIGCFFRQFFRSVKESDYLALRNGFINVHLGPGRKFDFQKYIKRSLEDDFKQVVEVSPLLWASFVVFLLVNISGTQILFWGSLIPLVIILAVGTKLQAILAQMAIEISERHAVVQGIPLVQGSDRYFWFGRPQLVLQLIHFAIFQNAFQITYFLWIWYSYGLNSCFHDNLKLSIIKVFLGVGVLLLTSYSTLPLYALVSQMGSHMKKSIFDEQTSKALENWHKGAKKKKNESTGRPTTRTLGDASPSPSMSPLPMSPKAQSSVPVLHRFKTTGHSALAEHNDQPNPESATAKLIVRVDYGDKDTEMAPPHPSDEQKRNADDFSFEKPAPLY